MNLKMRDYLRVIVTGFLYIMPFSLLAEKLTIACPQKDIPFEVELALTPAVQAKGLMFRASLPEDQGMLFVFLGDRPVTMWMKNTLIPLDMLFIDDAGKIMGIFENTKPFSLKAIGPASGTTQVLELKGGTVKKHGITKNCVVQINIKK